MPKQKQTDDTKAGSRTASKRGPAKTPAKAKRARPKKRKLGRLTRRQVALIRATRERWMEIGYSAEPADRPRAEEGVRLVYKAAGLKPPVIVWRDSPLAGAKEACVRGDDGHRERLTRIKERLDGEVKRRVLARLGPDALAQLDRGFEHHDNPAEIYGGIWYALWERAWDPVWAAVIEDFNADDEEIPPHLMSCITGSDTDWLAECDFYAQLGVFERLPMIEGLTLIARSAGWWWALDGVAILTDRPELLSHNGTLPHAAEGPAIRYRDGWEFWQ